MSPTAKKGPCAKCYCNLYTHSSRCNAVGEVCANTGFGAVKGCGNVLRMRALAWHEGVHVTAYTGVPYEVGGWTQDRQIAVPGKTNTAAPHAPTRATPLTSVCVCMSTGALYGSFPGLWSGGGN